MLPKLTIYNLVILTIFLLLAIIIMYPNCLFNNILEGNTSNKDVINSSVTKEFSNMDGQGGMCGNFSQTTPKKWDPSFNKDNKYTLSIDGNCMDYCNYKTYEILKNYNYNDKDSSNNPTSWINTCKNIYKSKDSQGKTIISKDISNNVFNWSKFKNDPNSFIDSNYYSNAKFCPYNNSNSNVLNSDVDISCSGYWGTVYNASKENSYSNNEKIDQKKIFGSKADRAKCIKHIDSNTCNDDTTCCWADTGCIVKNSNTKQLCGSSVKHNKKNNKHENSIDKALEQELSDIKANHSSNNSNHNKALVIIEKLLDSILGNNMTKDNNLGSYSTSIMNHRQISGNINTYNRDNSYTSLPESLLEGEDNNFKNSSINKIIPCNSSNFLRQF